MARVTVKLSKDHLQGLIRSPLHGLTELLWNAVDADAALVEAGVERDVFTAVESVYVIDNGHGMTDGEARRAFGALGESWKKSARKTRVERRALHGNNGKGRYSAFAMGSQVSWESVATYDDEQRRQIVISGSKDDLDQFDLRAPASTSSNTGTKVFIRGVDQEAAKQLERQSVVDHLSATFAIYLESYPLVMRWQGEDVDPEAIQEHRQTYPVTVAGIGAGEITLTVIEWKKQVKRALYLCDADGMTLHEIPPSIQAPGFEFTAYLRWAAFRDLGSVILLAELGHEQISPVVEAAREILRGHFKKRIEEKRTEMVRRWKDENTYPYKGAPQTPMETSERELFDIVAVAAAKAIEVGEAPARKLSLRLIREALETNPTALRKVLTDVVELSKDQLDDLSKLLERTTLPAIISGTRTIADRLAFLHGLDALLFDKLSKSQTLERQQLHRILANETWIFGEEYALTGDDDRLLEVLRKHLARLGQDVALAGTDPIRRYNGTEAIPDLVLSRSVQRRDNRLEHLVVELKRPSVTIGRAEQQQIEDYAHAVGKDERFNQPNVSWQFWIIGNDLDEYVRERAEAPDRAPGVVTQTKRYQVIAKTWAEVIADAKHRLKFFEESLALSSGRVDGIDYLRQAHAKLLPDVLRGDPPVSAQRGRPIAQSSLTAV